jgi:hypothetical protein
MNIKLTYEDKESWQQFTEYVSTKLTTEMNKLDNTEI